MNDTSTAADASPMALRLKLIAWLTACILTLTGSLAGCAAERVTRDNGNDIGPSLITTQAKLDRALVCPATFSGGHDPLLLVHGTGTNGDTWASGYVRELGALGYDACTVRLPNYAWTDIQISTEYVVNAVRRIKTRSGRRVAMIGHSQGALEMRWAIKWWPDIRQDVSNDISLAGVNHGAPMAIKSCASHPCPAAAWQMMPASKFLTALNLPAEKIGDSPSTNIYSSVDTVAVPPTSSVDGASNVAVQQVCPGRQVAHPDLIYDAVAFALVLDALSHQSAAEPRRIDASVCHQVFLTGLTARQVKRERYAGFVRTLLSYYFSSVQSFEPALKDYAANPRPAGELHDTWSSPPD